MSLEPPRNYGPDNPHPLSTRKTELIWEGKYDEYGNRREVDVAGMSMPMQRIETIDEPASRLKSQGELFNPQKSHRDDFRNMLIWGDNKLVMASLLKDFKGNIDLIYIDPPFDVGADFTMNIPIGDEKEMIEKDQSTLEMVAYRDMWGKGTDSYLQMMYERLSLMRELLSETGSIFVHCDWHVGHFIRSVLNEVFDENNFRNEVIWFYKKFARASEQFPKSHDNIYFYTKGTDNVFNAQYVPLSESTLKRWGNKKRGGKDPYNRYATDEESEGAAMPDVWDIPLPIGANPQNTGFQTQKPENLLERIINGCSDDGGLIADPFCGSGTTLAVAEKTGRRWIGVDLGRFAIHTSRKLLIEVQRLLHDAGKPYRSFDVYNLGRYERQWWQKERLKGADEEHRKVVLGFYRAEVLSDSISPFIHGRKGPALAYVAGIDSLLTRGEIRDVAAAAKEAGAREVHCLAWEFEMDLRLICNEIEHAEGIKIKLIPIPREIMEKNRTSPPPFLEVAVLEAQPIYAIGENGQKNVDIKLARFLPSLAEVPGKELEALKDRALRSGFDFIDFWAIDFDYEEGQPFEHHWQAYRTRKERKLPLVSDDRHAYGKPGKYAACVKVIDVFGCDTSIIVDVDYE